MCVCMVASWIELHTNRLKVVNCKECVTSGFLFSFEVPILLLLKKGQFEVYIRHQLRIYYNNNNNNSNNTKYLSNTTFSLCACACSHGIQRSCLIFLLWFCIFFPSLFGWFCENFMYFPFLLLFKGKQEIIVLFEMHCIVQWTMPCAPLLLWSEFLLTLFYKYFFVCSFRWTAIY